LTACFPGGNLAVVAEHERLPRKRTTARPRTPELPAERPPPDAGALRGRRAAGNRAAARLMRKNGKPVEIELQELTVRSLLDHLGREVPTRYPSFRCWQIGSSRVLVQWQVLQPGYAWTTGTRELITRFARGGLPLYRGIPIWHRAFKKAHEEGALEPFAPGDAEPGYVTQGTNFLPMSPDLDTALYAARARSGASQGQGAPAASVEDVPGFRADDPDQILGVVAAVTASPDAGCELVIFNPGEIQLRGPVRCGLAAVVRNRDL
jgi:hypothetical protein